MGWGEEKNCNAGEREEGGGSDTLHQNKYILFIDCSPAKREIKKIKKKKKKQTREGNTFFALLLYI